MLLFGIPVAAVGNRVPSLLIQYLLINTCGFSTIAFFGMGKENASTWGKYKLTLPVERTDIIKSYYINHMIWLLIGLLFAAVYIALSVLLHGAPFDKDTDILMLFTLGIGGGLLMGAIFFPLYHLAGEGKHEAVISISMLCAFIIFFGLGGLLSYLFAPMSTLQLVAAAISLIVIAVCAFALSFPLTVSLFKRKEY